MVKRCANVMIYPLPCATHTHSTWQGASVAWPTRAA
jgi:hypothetical protein